MSMLTTKIGSRKGSHKKKSPPKRFATIPNQLHAATFPKEGKFDLKYFEMRGFTTTVTIMNDYMFNLNSIYDPDRTGTGHQASGYDLWSNFYHRYRVDSVNVKINYSGVSPLVCAMMASNGATAITDPYQFLEAPGAQHKLYSLGGNNVSLSAHFDLAQINGCTKQIYRTDDRFQSLFGSSPAETIVLHVGVIEPVGTAVNAYYTVEMTMRCTFWDPFVIPSS